MATVFVAHIIINSTSFFPLHRIQIFFLYVANLVKNKTLGAIITFS